MRTQDVLATMARQAGLVSRAQVLALGGTDNDVERLVRRREWTRVHPGVYVEHTGPLTWTQRAWAGCLLHAPAALAGRSALTAFGVLAEGDEDLELVVDRRRRVDGRPGTRVHQVRDLPGLALLHLSPPRVRVEHAALTVAARATRDDAAVAVLADVVQQRRTTPARLVAALGERPRLRRRAFLADVLDDVASGAWSALERRYLCDVERAHGLPRAVRQQRVTTPGRVAFRDVRYERWSLLVELDGRLGHEAASDRWADLERDLHALASGEVTVRVGWRQVLAPCRLADAVGALLSTRGWRGVVRRCGPGCTSDGRGSPAPGAGDPRPSVA